ncbi:MAG TPA: hypothetical protein VI078_14585 [bacterium]
MANCLDDRRFLGLALAVALAGACATPAATPKGPLLLHPVPPVAKGYSLVQGAIVYAGSGVTISARPWDYRLVAQELARSGEPNPFGASEEATGRFLFIRVRLENRSARTLVFNPLRATLVQEGETPIIPVENGDLVAFAGEDIVAAEALARTFRRLSFDLTATVPAGGTLERYLVFRAPDGGPKKLLELRLDDLWLGPTAFDLRFPFELFPGK